jgi:quercetin dioxygenase-like cupin family protein
VDAEPITFLGRPLGPSFQARTVTIAPGGTRPYDEAEWRDALVVVECGAVVVECGAGGRRAFEQGDVLWLTGMGVRALHNEGVESAVLVAVSRRRVNETTDPR